MAPMAIRLTPHIMSVIEWSNPVNDPVRRQFISMRNELIADHHRLKLDSLNEEHDSPVKGLVHRYPTKALFLGKSPVRDFNSHNAKVFRKLHQFAMSIAASALGLMRSEQIPPR